MKLRHKMINHSYNLAFASSNAYMENSAIWDMLRRNTVMGPILGAKRQIVEELRSK